MPAVSLTGNQLPRLLSAPPCRSTAGPETVALAAKAGLILDPWQRFTLSTALGERRDGKWSAFEVGLIVSRQNGKGSILEARELAGLFLFGEQLLIHTAHEFKTAQEAFRRVRRLIESTPSLDRRVKKITESHGEEGIELLTGQRLRFIARSGGSGRGFTGDFIAYDEAMILEAHAVGASLPVLSARPNPQVWYTASAGLLAGTSTQLARVRRRGIAGEPNLAFLEWSIDPHTDECQPGCTLHDDYGDPVAWCRANPGVGFVHPDGSGLTIEAIERNRGAMDADTFANEILGVGTYPAALDGWSVVPKAWWERAVTGQQRPAQPVFGLDSAPDRSHTSIALCGAGSDGRRYAELVERRRGMAWAVERAVELDKRWSPAGWVIEARAAAGAFIDDLTDSGLNVITPSATEIGYGCGQLYDAFREQTLSVADDADVRRALAGSAQRTLAGQWAFDKAASTVDISPIVAVMLAHYGHVKYGADGDYSGGESVGYDVAEVLRHLHSGVYGPADVPRLYLAGLLSDTDLNVIAAAGFPVPANLT